MSTHIVSQARCLAFEAQHSFHPHCGIMRFIILLHIASHYAQFIDEDCESQRN